MLEGSIQQWDERREVIVAGDAEKTIEFAAEHWINSAKRAIQHRGRFAVALSGGSTPKAIYQLLLFKHQNKLDSTLDWSKVWLFWSDERAVEPTSPESNYKMAMDNGFAELPVPRGQIFRMQAEKSIEKASQDYANILNKHLGKDLFDLVMLGVGEDGHTASLFPGSPALNENIELVAFNRIPEMEQLRMTLTFPCLEKSAQSVILALGTNKQAIVSLVLHAAITSPFPASKVGTKDHKAFWILDKAAAHLL